MKTVFPDYRGGSIVNLISSIAAAFDTPASRYPPLSCIDAEPLRQARNIALLVIDGLGAAYLAGRCAGSVLQSRQLATLTSVFPSTTASAVTSLFTGVGPQQHGLTGWHMYFKELGAVTAVLPLIPRHGGPTLRAAGIDATPLLAGTPLFDRLPAECLMISPARIVDSDFNVRYTKAARRLAYQNVEECLALIAESARQPGPRRFIHAYYPELDATAHEAGIGSDATAACFARLDAAFATLLRRLAGSETALLVTADHGFIDSPPECLIDLADHQELEQMLVLPLCGERRAAYCYVHPQKAGDFEAYVASELAGRARLAASADLVADGWFGLGPAHPRLRERIGHYTLLMQEHWTIKDKLLGERAHKLVGVHGGISAAEMEVPLIVALL